MNKFILRVELINNDKYGVELEILNWDNRFISNSDDKKVSFKYFRDKDNFTIYSQSRGAMFDHCLEIPEYKYMHNENGTFIGAKITSNFYLEDERYEYLKKLCHCLNQWSTEYAEFKYDEPNIISFNNNYWIR